MLFLKDVVVYYGGVQALKGISLDVREGTITGLIGANGAGKSTTLKAISGLVPIASGEIRFDQKRIDGMPPEKIVPLGIVQVPEGKRLFLEMSVEDNLMAGAYLRKDKERTADDLERIYSYFPGLKRARNRPASDLSGGEQQMLAIGRGLMASPKVLLLDEPSLGLSPLLTKEVAGIIRRIAEADVSILLIEQNANLAFQLVKKIYVMETGTITLEGEPSELRNNPYVREAYLGLAPTEEIQPRAVAPRIPTVPAAETARQKRWQDKIPQMRFQDRASEGRWQDKFIRGVTADRHRETEPVGKVASSVGQDRHQMSHEFTRAIGEKPIRLNHGVDTWSGLRGTAERWPSEERRELQYRAMNLCEDRWRTERREEERSLGERWEKEARLFERRPEVGRPGQRKLPGRVIKRIIVPIVQKPRKEKDF